MSMLLDAALAYREREWSVLPVGADKKPLLPSWKKYQSKRASQTIIREWFENDFQTGVGIICGDISGGLTVRDFDDPEAYEAWAISCPELVDVLPTVKTSRGFHVYFLSQHRVIKKYDDGELRGGGYVLAPPSLHPDGTVYEWINPLPDGALVKIDPFSFGLACNRETEIRRDGDTEIQRMASVSLLQNVIPDEIRQIIQTTLPKSVGHRNYAIFDLARTLKAIPSLHDADGSFLKPIVKEWHQQALPFIGTKPFDETWAEFRYGWDRVIFPKGSDLMIEIINRAKSSEPPAIASEYDCPHTISLICLCRELQKAKGDKPFFLSCRSAAMILGMDDHTTASRRLNLLVVDGVLKIVEPGTKTRATRYLYSGDPL